MKMKMKENDEDERESQGFSQWVQDGGIDFKREGIIKDINEGLCN